MGIEGSGLTSFIGLRERRKQEKKKKKGKKVKKLKVLCQRSKLKEILGWL